MSIFGTIFGTDAANAAKSAAADTFAKKQAAGQGLRDFGDQYAGDYRDLSTRFDPYTRAGGEAAGAFTNLLRDPSSVRSLPGYQFARDEGLSALDKGAAARSGVMNGRLLKDTERFATGLADQTYGNQFNRLMGATGQGAQATQAQVGTVGQGLNGQLQTRTSSYGGDMQNADTIGQGDIAAQNAKTSAFQNLLNAGVSLGGAALGGGLPFGNISGAFKGLMGGGQQSNPWMVGSANRIPMAGTNF